LFVVADRVFALARLLRFLLARLRAVRNSLLDYSTPAGSDIPVLLPAL